MHQSPQSWKRIANAAEVRLQPEPLRLIQIPDTVRRAQSGDQHAFELLYKENVGRVYAVCLRIAADRARAEELTQNVFVRLCLTAFKDCDCTVLWVY